MAARAGSRAALAALRARGATGWGSMPLVAVLSLLLGGASALPVPGGDAVTLQADPPVQPAESPFETKTEIVQVDVGVMDAEGRPVRGLEADDFVLEEDGVAQKVESFKAVAVLEGATAEPWVGGRVSTNTGPPGATRRTFVVVLDDIHLSEAGAARTRTAVADLVKRLRKGDQVGVVSTSGAIWCSGRVEPEREGLLAATERLKGLRPPELRGADQITDFEAVRIVERNDAVVLKNVVERWTRGAKIWEQTWGADSAPAAALGGPGTSLAMAGPRSTMGSTSSETQTVQALATQVYEAARQRRQRALQTLVRVLSALRGVEGRKSLILFSESFLNDPSDRQFTLVSEASRRANTPIYVVDAGGLVRPDLQADQRRFEDRGPALDERQELRASLTTVAEACGGFALTGTNDLAVGLERLVDESTHYYLLGYQPTNRVLDGGFRRIHVSVRRPDVHVRARAGYYAVPADPLSGAGRTHEDPAQRLREAVDAPFPLPGIGLRMSAYTFDPRRGGTTRTLLVSELKLDDLAFEEKGGQVSAEVDVLLALTHYATGRTLGDRPVAIQLAARSDVRGYDAWHRITQEVDLPPGLWLAKLVVRDRRSGVVGSVTHSLDVPGGGHWRTSTPVLSDAVSSDPTEEQPHALPLARRTFPAAGVLYCEFEVYDQNLDGTTPPPRVSAGYALVHPGGAVERQAKPTTIDPRADRRLVRLIAVPLRGLKPGDYDLVLRIDDAVTGQTRELHEPVSLARPARPTLAFYKDLAQDYVDGRGEDAVATLITWPTAVVAGLARRIDPSEGPLSRAAAMLHTEAAMALLAGGEASDAPAHLDVARGILERAGRDSAFRRDWLLALGFQMQARGDAAEALRFFQECETAFPQAAEAWLGAGTIYEFSAFPDGLGGSRVARAGGDLVGEAKRHYRQALAVDPSLAEARVRLGRVLQRTGEREQALVELERVGKQGGGGPTEALAHFFLGEILEERGQSEEAARQYRTALDQDPNLQPAGLALGEILGRRGDRTGTVEALGKALRSGCPVGPPKWLAYHLGLGVRAAAAIDALRRAVRS
jgi:VWFA-related protein